MNHPTGIDWSANQPAKPSSAPSNAFSNLSLKPSPLTSRTASPAGPSAPQNGTASKKGGDSFSNLVPFGRDKQNSNLSLLEQQKKLEEQRQKDDEERQRKMDALFGGGGGAGDGFWNALDGKGSSSVPAHTVVDDDDDILAAFNSATPVDSSSHFPPPPPPPPPNSNSTPQTSASASAGIDMLLNPTPSKLRTSTPSDPFDPFDVQNLPSRDQFSAQPTPQVQDDDDFDILGDLAKPVSELPPRPLPTPSPKPESRRQSSPPPRSDPRDHAIAEIMDMGFTAEQAMQALAETETGIDVEGAVGWLLEQAHRKSKPTTLAERPGSKQSRWDTSSDERERESDDASVLAWARGGGKSGGEKDLGAYAVEVGGTLFKSANSLWSTGRKKMEKAVAEFKADLVDGGGDPNQPKWMRERQIREELEKRGARGISRQDRPPPGQFEDDEQSPSSTQEVQITDEALMLEMGSGPPQPRKPGEKKPPPPVPSRDLAISEREQIQRQRMQEMEAAIWEKEREMRERERAKAASIIPDSATRKAKLAAENEPVYVSRNRRRPPPATSSKPSTPEPDLLGGGGGGGRAGSSLNPFARDVAAERQRTAHPPTPIATPLSRRRPPLRQRLSVPISPSAISQSNGARQKGTEAFKRGDYTAAQTFYTTALNPIPDLHPLRIIVLTNRTLCTVKLGDPKSALIDVEAILTLIGDSRGEGETISLDGAEKDMKEYWTKAVSRKAECLEQLEKWGDAKTAWELALTAGGNAAAINGKRRCEAALKPKAPPKPKPKAPVVAPRRPPPVPARPSGAVTALRQANAAQEKQEAERLELHDVVHERIGNWKNGKEGNLRALLAGLDTVLWEGSGWKKVGMGELLVPQKCKVAYMKGIAKVHPDKVCFPVEG